jgi:hypothetical protein
MSVPERVTPAETPGAEPHAALPKGAARKVIAALVLVLIVMGLFAVSLIGAGRKPVPHNLPFGVVGSSSLVTAVGKQLSLKTIQYPNESAVQQAIDQTDIYGALIPGTSADTLILVPSASFVVQIELGPAFRKAAAEQHTQLVVQQSHPLPSDNPTGNVPGLVLLPLLIGGYLASVLLMKATGKATAPGRGAIIVAYAFAGALLTDLIAGPLIGAYPNSHFWALWPIFALITASVALPAAVLERALGVLGTVAVVVLFIILGGASAGGGGIPLLPPFWRAIGAYLPPQNAVVLIRSTLVFGGNGTTHAFVVLGLWVLAGLVLGFLFYRFRPQKPPAGAAAPGSAAGSSSRSGVRLVVGALFVVAVMQCLFTLNYTSADRNPVATNLPFGVTAASPLTTAVQKQMSLKTIQYPNESAVSQAFDQGKLYGALIPGSGTNTLLLVGSASSYAGYPLTTYFEDAAAQQKATLKVQASNNPPAGDPFGVIPSLILIPLLIGGYVASTALMSATGTPTGRGRVAILAGFAVVGGLLMDLISGAFAWGWPIHQFWPLWPIMALLIFAVAAVASVLQKLLGAAGTLLTIIVLIQFGNPSSGGSTGVPFLPTFWRDIGPYLPPRNGLTAIHNTMYFNGNGITQALVILGIYAVVFGALSSVLGWYRTPQVPGTPETQLQAASVSVAGTAVV